MAYSIQSDVEQSAGGADRLINLADWNQDGLVDALVVTEHVEKADAWIDSFLARAPAPPTLPMSPVTSVIKWLSADEAVFLMRVARGLVTDLDKERHAERLAWLTRVADGEVIIQPPPGTLGAPEFQLRQSGSGVQTRDDFDGLPTFQVVL